MEVEIEILKVDTRAFLKLGSTSVEIKDYKISSPMHGRTELEVVFEFYGEITEFSSKANLSERSQQSQ